jgi:hypothetical protein
MGFCRPTSFSNFKMPEGDLGPPDAIGFTCTNFRNGLPGSVFKFEAALL